MNKYINYNGTIELHRELTNIMLLSIEDDGFFYCYCCEEIGDCGICSLAEFFLDPHEKNLMDGLPPRRFLAINYNNKDKLEEISLKVLPFFERIEKEHKISLEFYKKEYSWSLKDKSSSVTCHLELDDIIENEILRFEKEE